MDNRISPQLSAPGTRGGIPRGNVSTSKADGVRSQSGTLARVVTEQIPDLFLDAAALKLKPLELQTFARIVDNSRLHDRSYCIELAKTLNVCAPSWYRHSKVRFIVLFSDPAIRKAFDALLPVQKKFPVTAEKLDPEIRKAIDALLPVQKTFPVTAEKLDPEIRKAFNALLPVQKTFPVIAEKLEGIHMSDWVVSCGRVRAYRRKKEEASMLALVKFWEGVVAGRPTVGKFLVGKHEVHCKEEERKHGRAKRRQHEHEAPRER